jgi:hypothetical protein
VELAIGKLCRQLCSYVYLNAMHRVFAIDAELSGLELRKDYFRQAVQTASVVLLLAAGSTGALAADKSISVKIEVAAKELLSGDFCPYKIVITNNGISSVTLETAIEGQGLIIFMEHRVKGEKEKEGSEWILVRTHSAQTEGLVQGHILLDGKQSFVKFGSAFRDGKGGLVFATVGTHELRARVKCPIGEYVTEPIAISVEERNADQVALIQNNSGKLRIILDQLIPTDSRFELVSDLAKNLQGGGDSRFA